MSKTVPLFVAITPGDPRSITRQITDGIRMEIATGKLATGAQLPSVRGLAEQLAVNPKTVAKAYGELESEGWLLARQGMGLFVAVPRQRLSDTERERRLTVALDAFCSEIVGLGYPLEHVIEHVNARLTPVLTRRTA